MKTNFNLEVRKIDIHEDNRGYFCEIYKGENGNMFCQDNISRSEYGVLRGLHFQEAPFSQAKIIQVLLGSIYDVVVCIDKGSSDYGKWDAVHLTNGEQLFVPVGYAHGFQCLGMNNLVLYKMSDYYSFDHQKTIIWNDPDIGIEWPVKDPILSEKDANGQRLRDIYGIKSHK